MKYKNIKLKKNYFSKPEIVQSHHRQDIRFHDLIQMLDGSSS